MAEIVLGFPFKSSLKEEFLDFLFFTINSYPHGCEVLGIFVYLQKNNIFMYALCLDFCETLESEEQFICIQVDTQKEPLMHYMQQQVFSDFNGYEIDPDIMWFPELEDDAEVQDVYFLYKIFIVEI